MEGQLHPIPNLQMTQCHHKHTEALINEAHHDSLPGLEWHCNNAKAITAGEVSDHTLNSLLQGCTRHSMQFAHPHPNPQPHKSQKWIYKIKLLQFVQVILSTVQFNRTQKHLFDLVIQFRILRVELISTMYNNY